MKKSIVSVLGIALLLAVVSCSQTKDRYIDLRTGKSVNLVQDEESGLLVDETTNRPVYMYVDTKTGDTIYGRTGAVINGQVTRDGNGEYVYVNELESYKTKDGDYEMKLDDDGDVKIKDGDKKTKVDGKTGEKKVKEDD